VEARLYERRKAQTLTTTSQWHKCSKEEREITRTKKEKKGMVSIALTKQHQICQRITTKVVEAATLGDLGNPKPREEGGAADS